MKRDVPLTERQKAILQAVINTYITTAEAVGSRTISKKMGFKLSPASIRNVMSDLEEMGYISQPHTSAGRVPTDTGYRVYVDNLMEIRRVELEEQHHIEELYRSRVKQIEDLMELSSRLLSILTHYTAVVQIPKIETETIKHVEVVPLAAGKTLVMLVTNIGNVKKQVAVLSEPTAGSDIERVAVFLNEKLHALSFASARSLLNLLCESADPDGKRLAALGQSLLSELLAEGRTREVYLEGRENIFDQPEFRDFDRLRPLLRVLDEKRRLNELLEYCVPGEEPLNVCIRIGSD
ncbi:MAG: heat-inducible transcription repressor HrcA [Candidatus Lindowbacteria bacterium]|nr:heat-inducible transcription repressor HrcA [Candidatus Lindowbacteria bacterium]